MKGDKLTMKNYELKRRENLMKATKKRTIRTIWKNKNDLVKNNHLDKNLLKDLLKKKEIIIGWDVTTLKDDFEFFEIAKDFYSMFGDDYIKSWEQELKEKNYYEKYDFRVRNYYAEVYDLVDVEFSVTIETVNNKSEITKIEYR